MSVDLRGMGHQESVTISTPTDTMTIADQGLVQDVRVTSVITLLATVVGYSYTFRVGAPGIIVSISPNALDLIAGNGFTAADDKDLVFTNQPAGSFVTVVGNGTTGWNVTAISGTATREA